MTFAAGVQACRPGVDGIQPVHQAFVDQKIKRAIDRGGRGALLVIAYQFQQLVGFQAALLYKQNFQHPAPYGRKAFAALYA
jgi:hypothetical protein